MSSVRQRRVTLSRCAVVVLLAGVTVGGSAATAAVGAPAGGQPAILHVGQIAQQDVRVLPGSEPDTLVEPDVAVSPLNANIAIAASHDGRYPDGGAVGIETAWTADGGATWHHQPLPKVTTATGGRVWTRASDPVLAFGADGTAYISVLVFDAGCDSAVVVSRSTDGGRTFGAPVAAHRSSNCAISDDKNWLLVDTGPKSPHRGRLYQFWTPFLTDMFGNADGSPQALVWSDNGGRTWSAPVSVTAPHANTQNSQPMLLPNGTLVDTYLDYGPNGSAEGPEAGDARHAAGRSTARARSRAAAIVYPLLATRISTDGGKTWTDGGTVSDDIGGGAPGFRCCLTSATADPLTGDLYAVWNSNDATFVRLSRSTDGGKTWSAPVTVNRPDPALLGVNVDVAARAATVTVSFGLTNADTSRGRFGRQFVATSRDGGLTFLDPQPVGPRSDYRYAAQAGGIFPGDYIGSALSADRLYAVWMVASRPPTAGAKYHQVLYAAVFDTQRSPLLSRPPTARAAVLSAG